MISVRDLTFRYKGTDAPALSEVSLEVAEGEFCVVIGANGAGKTSLCYLLAGFMPQFFEGYLEGDVSIDEEDVLPVAPSELAGQVGLLFQNPFNQITGARFTVREEVAFGMENLGVPRDEMEERVAAALELVGLDGLEGRSPFALSGGQQQRLAIASVLVMEPRVLILDEPTSQLDPVGTREVFSALDRLSAEKRATIVLAEHKIEWAAAFADRVIALERGRILADGPPRAVLGQDLPLSDSLPQTRYTRISRRLRRQGLAPQDGALPVTLEEAVEFLQ